VGTTSRSVRVDRYRLLKVLGRGGMGTVYLAEDTALGRRVALKAVHDHLLGDDPERLVALFQREARILAGLNHPGITQIFDYSGLYSTRLYLVMEYVDGVDLTTLLDLAGELPHRGVANAIVGLTAPLHHAHSRGVVHQDLKPDNILLGRDGVLKLTDFGIAQRLVRGASTAPGEIVGTPAFMAPERATGEGADARADIFSLGATLYTLLAGQPIVDDEDALAALHAIARGDILPLKDLVPHVPDDVAAVVHRALAPSPADRWPDALAFGRALARAAAVPPPDPSSPPRAPTLLPLLAASDASPPTASGTETASYLAGADHTADTVRLPPTADAADALLPHAPPPSPPLTPTPARDTASSPLVQGRFRLLAKVGVGAVGEVWRAADTAHDDALVALKVFRPVRGASVDEFKAEFGALANLRHPNLVTIHDFGYLDLPGGGVDEEPPAFYTMEWLDGVNLRRAAEQAPPATVYGLLVQVARALVFLHSATGRPHLDVKPENVLVTTDADGRQRAVLTDPGNLAEKLRSVQAGERGSLPYAAPETLRGFTAGLPADLFAFGVTAFEVLTGTRPFRGRTPAELKAALLEAPPPDAHRLRPEVAPQVARALAAFMAKAPSARPRSAAAWIEAVNEVVVPPYPVETHETQLGRLASGPAVGRGPQRETLISAYRDAATPGSTTPRVWVLSGAPGSGKGRLLDELRRAAQLDGARVYETAPPRPNGASLAPLLPLLRARRATLGSRHPLVRTHTAALSRLLDDPLDRRPQAQHEAPGAPGTEPQAPPLTPDAIAALLLADLGPTPTLFLARGADRVDAATAEVLAHLTRRLAPLGVLASADGASPRGGAAAEPVGGLPPALLVMTADADGDVPGDRAAGNPEPPGGDLLGPITALAGPGAVGHVPLPGLGVAAVGELVRTVLGDTPLSAPELQDLHRVTGGNPGQVLAVLETLLERGDLLADGGRWRLRAGAEIPLPPGAEAAFAARLERLTPAEREVLEALCVFDAPVPVRIIDSLGPQAVASVAALETARWLERTLVGGEVRVQFASDHARSLLYRELSPSVRASRHRAAAAWIETHRPEGFGVEALATQWRLGERADRALSFLVEAAARSRSAGDPEGALERYETALGLLPDAGLGILRRLGVEAEIQQALGEIHRASGRHDRAAAAFERLEAIGRDLEREDLVGLAEDRLALVMIESGRYEDALRWASARLASAERSGDRRGQALALRLIGVVWRELDGPEAGRRDLERALEVAGESPELADVRARIAVTMSFTETQAGAPEEGLRWAEEALELAHEAQAPELAVSARINASMAWFVLGRPDQTLAVAEEALAAARASGLRLFETYALVNVGDSLRAMGQFDEAAVRLQEALRATYELGGDQIVARLVELASLSMDRGRGDEAVPFLREAWRLTPGLRLDRYRLDVVLAELRLRLWAHGGRSLAASAHETPALLSDASARAEVLADPIVSARVRGLSATLAASGGEQRAALAHAQAVLRLADPEALASHPDLACATLAVLRDLGQGRAAEATRRRVAAALTARAGRIASQELRRSMLETPLHRCLTRGPEPV